ncbi:hypothetical protein [Promicromonospora kroppenstedtii]|uniref:hypothetical protein n=1 Tax=Promicromonospora kroppenstedtii TaxID=440482 RepID=UPI0012F9DDF8|nr:hypothetical protein [Promicromonospora kroppenstedtii]
MMIDLSWGQAEEWSWIREMNREPERWVVVGDVLPQGTKSKDELAMHIRELCADFELQRWVLVQTRSGMAGLQAGSFPIPVTDTTLRGSRDWAVRVIHNRFTVGSWRIQLDAAPVQFFTYEREDGIYSAVIAASHMFADAAGLKAFTQQLSRRIANTSQAGRTMQILPLSSVLEHENRRLHSRRSKLNAQQSASSLLEYESYWSGFEWERLRVREKGTAIYSLPISRTSRLINSNPTSILLMCIGAAWRECIRAPKDLRVPMSLLHRRASPVPGAAYMGPGNVNLTLPATELQLPVLSGVFASKLWRTLLNEARASEHHPLDFDSNLNLDRARSLRARSLRLNVRRNANELGRASSGEVLEVQGASFELEIVPEVARAFVDLSFADEWISLRWDLPRAREPRDATKSFGGVLNSLLENLVGRSTEARID